MSRIKPNELPEEIKGMMREKFEADPRVRELHVRAHRLQQTGNFMGAMQVRKQIEQLFDKVIVSYCVEAESQVEEEEKRIGEDEASVADAFTNEPTL